MNTPNIIRKTVLTGIAFAAFGAAAAAAIGGGQDVDAAGRSGVDNFEIQVSMSRYAIATDGAKGGNVEFKWNFEQADFAPADFIDLSGDARSKGDEHEIEYDLVASK